MTVKCFFDRRITPAHTGKTYLILHLCLFPDHPRSHGENFLKSGSLARMRGSPPRMRGKPDAKLSQVPDVGITPAHAGKTQGIPRVTARKLRITPARTGKTLKPVLAMGSPPHARGKHYMLFALTQARNNILYNGIKLHLTSFIFDIHILYYIQFKNTRKISSHSF